MARVVALLCVLACRISSFRHHRRGRRLATRRRVEDDDGFADTPAADAAAGFGDDELFGEPWAGNGFEKALATVGKLFTARDSAFVFQRPVFRELEGERLDREEDRAVEACATGDRLEILAAVDALEAAKLTPEDLLDASLAGLDGRWSLLATVAGRSEGDAELNSTGVSNSVNASGIMVEATPDKLPVQVFDVARGRVSNEVSVDLPFDLGSAFVRVSGRFARGANGRRANVRFDNLEFFASDGARKAELPWVFGLANRFRPDLAAGDAETSWLETTYLSDRVRVGRGNKGSVFVLEKIAGPCPLTPAEF